MRRPTSTASPDGTDPALAMLRAAEALVPTIHAARDAAEQLRHCPPALAEALAGAGFLQMYLPRSLGGPQLSPLAAFHIVETLSRADGSVGWCAMIASSLSDYAGWFAPDVARAMAGTPADLRAAGSIRPLGRAVVVPGGWRVSGRWDFASGVTHAKWLVATSVLHDDNGPRRTPAGAPVWRVMWVPKAEARVIDTWNVMGLRGTGSHDFEIEDVFVPTAHSMLPAERPVLAAPNYNARFHSTWVWTATVALALGIARGAMDAFTEMATARASTMSTALLRDRPLVQARTGEAEAIISAARAYVLHAVGTAWDAAHSGTTDLDAIIMQARLAIAHGMHEAKRAIDILFHAAGTNAVYAPGRLERCFRDIHVAVQHGAGLPVHFESAGKVVLGLRPTDPGW